MRYTAHLRAALVLVLAASVAGCVDVRSFEGEWRGSIVEDPAVRQGFSPDAEVAPLMLAGITLQTLDATLTTNDGKFSATPLTRVSRASSDALGSLTFEGDPLRSYLLFGPVNEASEGGPATMIVSLYGDSHVEMRIFRGSDIFGVFYLRRPEDVDKP
ncbi:MAG: hypothetical protein KC503_09300 [Myxococcales bacterium]|nr:hypothetical protein [Myxococcales bacterium]